MPIGEQAAAWIARVPARRARRELLKGRTSPRLFLNARGGPLSRVGFWKILKQHGARGAACRARSARTSCATRSPRICSSAAPTCARFR